MSVVAYANKTDVYGGPGISYAKIGSVGSTTGPEEIVVLSYEKGWFFIEYQASGQSKRGYVQEMSIVNSTTVKSQVIHVTPSGYGGTTAVNATVYGAPSINASTIGSLNAGEDVTVFSGIDSSFAFVEYSTSNGSKRGYIRISDLLQGQRGKLCNIYVSSEIVYGGPGVSYASIGSVGLNECIVALEYDGIWLYIEYNTTSGRKRGYIRVSSVAEKSVTSYIPAANYTKMYLGKMLSAQTVLAAPSTGCAPIGSVSINELIKVIREERGSLFVEYSTSSGNKRGFVPITSVNQNVIFPGEENAVIGYMSEQSAVNSGPGSEYAVIGSVNSNEQVKVLWYEDGWFSISYSIEFGRKIGYTPAKVVKEWQNIMKVVSSMSFIGKAGYALGRLTAFTGPSEDYPSAGTIFDGEGITVFDRVTNGYTLVEFSTPNRTKRGYVLSTLISTNDSTCVCKMIESTSVYSGPDTSYMNVGGVSAGEIVVALREFDNSVYIEYNTPSGRKRGYVSKAYISGFSGIPIGSYVGVHYGIANSDIDVYYGPNDNYAKVGSLFANERVSVFADIERGWLYIEYYSPSGTKRGYVPVSSLTQLYSYNIPVLITNAERLVYGTSGKGRDLVAYKISGDGSDNRKIVVVLCAVHGFEDAWNRDGEELVKIGYRVVEKAQEYVGQHGNLNGWTLYVIPCANPDGLIDGFTNNGPGRCTIKDRIDINRCFEVGFVPQYSSRNYTSSNPLGAVEARSLKTFIENLKNECMGSMVLLDMHGWLNKTYGNGEVSQFFRNEFGMSHVSSYGQGYITTWANSIGIKSALLEFPMPANPQDIEIRSFADKAANSVLALIQSQIGNEIPQENVLIGYGAAGDDVAVIQFFLKQEDIFTAQIDGEYLQSTVDAVYTWQRRYNEINDPDIIVDGVVGRQTWTAMGFIVTNNGEVDRSSSKYQAYLNSALSAGYFDYKMQREGYISIIDYLQGKLPEKSISIRDGYVYIDTTKVDLHINIKSHYSSNVAYATPEDLDKVLEAYERMAYYMNILIFQSPRKKGLDEDGNQANDMKTNDYTAEQILAINPLFQLQLAEANTPEVLFREFETMATTLFATGEMNGVILDMINHFKNGNGADYRNAILTAQVSEHSTTQEYIDLVKNIFISQLAIHHGNIFELEYKEETKSSNVLYNRIMENRGKFPVFNSWADTLGGLRITVNDTWGNNVEVRNYSKDGNRLSGTLHFTIYDHFGLDQPDVEKVYVNLAGFRAWFVLQHYKEFNGQYKPFVTMMEIDVPFEMFLASDGEQT